MNYEDMTREDFQRIVDTLSPEWGSLGDGILVDYETGRHYRLPSEEAAEFLASAYHMLTEILKRLPSPAPSPVDLLENVLSDAAKDDPDTWQDIIDEPYG
jgi:hypothetical protein